MPSSIYPNAIDGQAQIAIAIDDITPIDEDLLNSLRSAIIAIEEELGVMPSDIFDTVSARLDALEGGDDFSGIQNILDRLTVVEEAIDNLLPPLSNQQYSVLMEDPGGTLIFQRLTQSMIADDFSIGSFSVSGSSLVEVGSTVTNPSFSASYTVPPTSAFISDNRGNLSSDVIGNPNSFTYSNSYTENSYGASVSWTLTASDGTISDVANDNKTWVQRSYWGVGAAGGNNAAFIQALSGSALDNNRSRSFTVTASSTEKIYFAYRAAFGDATFTVGGFSGGFIKVSDSISVTNAFGFTEDYTLYESDNLGLGTTTVVVS